MNDFFHLSIWTVSKADAWYLSLEFQKRSSSQRYRLSKYWQYIFCVIKPKKWVFFPQRVLKHNCLIYVYSTFLFANYQRLFPEPQSMSHHSEHNRIDRIKKVFPGYENAWVVMIDASYINVYSQFQVICPGYTQGALDI